MTVYTKFLTPSVLRSIEHLQGNDLPITVITSVNTMNINNLEKLYSVLLKVGIKRWRIQLTFSLGRAVKNNLQISITQFKDLFETISRISKRAKEDGFELVLGDNIDYCSSFGGVEWKGCSAGIITCGITADGKVKGCLTLPDSFSDGDLFHSDLWDIWFSPDSFKYNRNTDTMSIGVNCNGCAHKEKCLGGCSVMSYASTGVLHNSPYCYHRLTAQRAVT